LLERCEERQYKEAGELPVRVHTEMRVITARAPKVPRKTRDLDSFNASKTAMKKVLSPNSENRIKRKPDNTPSLKGDESPPANEAPVTPKVLMLAQSCVGSSMLFESSSH
jgi:hypothetical protein